MLNSDLLLISLPLGEFHRVRLLFRVNRSVVYRSFLVERSVNLDSSIGAYSEFQIPDLEFGFDNTDMAGQSDDGKDH